MNHKSKKRSNKNPAENPSGKQTGKQTTGKQTTGKDSGNDNDPPEEDDRDPAVIRAEEIRTGASRELVEAFVVAFILALLFRAFIAEAFVIPTGSMAPTLMGAHKDLFCDRCDHNFPVGASLERSGGRSDQTVVAGICPNCRHVNSLDLASDSDHHTFNGDRILVSKFAYTLAEPERWDVIVFKFPGNPKQNYIKRLVGLPNETLTIHHGDVFTRPTGTEQTNAIVRKPPDKLLAMRHHVYDTSFQSQALIDAKYPTRWQPWSEKTESPPTDSWKLERSADGVTGKLTATDEQKTHWLRYFHHWPTPQEWDAIDNGQSMADVDPYTTSLITDFYAYDSFVHVPSELVYRRKPGQSSPNSSFVGRAFSTAKSFVTGPDFTLNPSYKSGESPQQFGRYALFGGPSNNGADGMHWVGDLIFEADVETSSTAKELVCELVEAGIKYRCHVDLSNGNAVLKIDDIESQRSFASPDGKSVQNPSAKTEIRAGARHSIRYSNCDDEILLWVDGELVSFDGPTTFDSRKFRADADHSPQYVSGIHPLDGAPVGLAVRGGNATVHQLRIDRDKYYISTKQSAELFDYDMSMLWENAQRGFSVDQIQDVFREPSKWGSFPGWQARRSVSFEMKADQFFPMGDNSPHSLDARCWAGTKVGYGTLPDRFKDQAYKWSEADYVPRDLLVGKALLVFWPHPWRTPVPCTPNTKRFRLIR